MIRPLQKDPLKIRVKWLFKALWCFIVGHEWDSWYDSDYDDQAFCTRCGHTEEFFMAEKTIAGFIRRAKSSFYWWWHDLLNRNTEFDTEDIPF